MKKQLVLGLGLAVLAAPAFASKARLQALGEDVNGSFYINDNRNVFLNAAQVNNQKDLATFEWGSGKQGDLEEAPNAEGGVYKTVNNMVYGLHLGRDLAFNKGAELASTGATGTAIAHDASNAIDLFVGGDAGFKWGANLTYAKSNDESKTATATLGKAEAQVIDLNVGALFGDFTAYVKAGVVGESKDTKRTANIYDIERKASYEVGGSYQLKEYTLFAQYSMNEFKNSKNAKTTVDQGRILVGAGRNDKINDKTTLFTKLQASQTTSEVKKSVAVADDSDATDYAVPVVIGLEHDTTSWLALRGSVSQNLWSKNKDKKKKTESTTANSTEVNVGATLKFGELSLDGVIGAGNTTGTVGQSNNSRGVLSLDNAMTRVSMTYRF